jgi:hypothetical protein
MCAVYADNLCRVIGWTVAYVGCLTRCPMPPANVPRFERDDESLEGEDADLAKIPA